MAGGTCRRKLEESLQYVDFVLLLQRKGEIISIVSINMFATGMWSNHGQINIY